MSKNSHRVCFTSALLNLLLAWFLQQGFCAFATGRLDSPLLRTESSQSNRIQSLELIQIGDAINLSERGVVASGSLYSLPRLRADRWIA